MATVSNGISGPNATMIELGGPIAVPLVELALVEDDGRVTDLVDRLLYPARKIQNRLLQRFHRMDMKLLREVLAGEKGGINYRKALKEHERAIFGTGSYPIPRHDIEFSPDGNIYDRDVIDDDLISRLDLVVRPGFLIESPKLTTLRKLVASLHRAAGLLWGGPHFLVDDLKREEIGKFLGQLRGGRVPVPPLLCGGRKEESQPCQVSWMLKAGIETTSRPEVQALLRDSLLIQASPTSMKSLPSQSEISSAYHSWQRLVDRAMYARRRGYDWEHGVANEHGRAEFEERNREYRIQCQKSGVRSQTVIQLPRILVCMPIAQNREDLIRMSVEECFLHAETLCRRHQQLWCKAKSREQVDETIQLAKRLLERIRDRQPLAQRDLVRSFDKQRKELYLPTLDLMQRAHLIVEGPGKVYTTGSARDVEGSLKPLIETQHLRVVA
jgi:hypothetical protein